MRALSFFVALALWACPTQKPAQGAGAVPHSASVEAFWGWFKANEGTLASRARSTELVEVMNETSSKLGLAREGLFVEIAVEPDAERKHTLVISAGGDRKLFPEVKRVAAAAPALGSWSVVALRQRRDPGLAWEIDGESYSVGDFFFRERGRAKGKVDVDVLVRGFRPERQDELTQASFLLLDIVLGEYDTETKLGAIEVLALPETPGPEVKPLVALAKVVDGL